MQTFPCTIAGRDFPDAPSLAQAVHADAQAGGGTVVAGQSPATWLGQALTEGQVDRPLLVGLAAALVRAARPPSVVAAAELARAQALGELAPVFEAALAGLDMGVLLHPDPLRGDGSVEDALLRAWGEVEPGDPERTVLLLDRLRNAGLRSEELAALCRLGDAGAVRSRLPPILVEDLLVEDVESLAAALGRGGDVAQAVCAASGPLSASQRYAIWRSAIAGVPALAGDDALQSHWLVTDGSSEAVGGVN